MTTKAVSKEQEQQPVDETLTALKKALAEQEKLAEERLNHLKYLQADFDNYRKHFEKEKEHIIQLANESLIKELLMIYEDLERAVQHDQHKDGLLLVQKNLWKILEKHGVKVIESIGKQVDPHLHEVVMKVPSDQEEGIIVEEVQRGFMLKSKVIRPAQVKVAAHQDIKNKEK